jgi:hypothetical protein
LARRFCQAILQARLPAQNGPRDESTLNGSPPQTLRLQSYSSRRCGGDEGPKKGD